MTQNTLRKTALSLALAGAMAPGLALATDPVRELEYRDAGGSDFQGAALDSAGNVFVTRGSGRNFITSKYAPEGTLLWQRNHQTPNGSWYGPTSNIAVDSQGNSYVALSNSYEYGRLLKYDTNGNEQLLFAGSGIAYAWDHGIRVSTDSNDNVYVYATRYVEKYAPDGTRLWRTDFSNKWGAPTRDLEVDARGNIYVLGLRDASNWYNIVLEKYTADGQVVWMQSFPVNGSSNPVGVEIDSQGNLVIAANRTGVNGYYVDTLLKYSPAGALLTSLDIDRGNYSRTTAFELDPQDNAYLTGTVNGDLYLEKLDANQARQWLQVRDFGWNDNGNDLALDAKGNVYVTGNAATGSHWSNEAFATLKWDSNGVEQWALRDVRGSGDWIGLRDGKVYSGGRTLWPHNALVIRYDDASNTPPVADAGQYPLQECSGQLTNVLLDGSGSSDADGDLLSYSWSGSFGSASGATALAGFTLGTHPVTLTVADGNGGSDAQTVAITVQDSTPPTVDAGADRVIIAPNVAGAAFTLPYTAEDRCGAVNTTVTPQLASYPVGNHRLTVTATDASGNVASDQMTLTVAYDFGGFLAPLTANGVYKLGRTLPVKIQLLYGDGSLVTDAQPTLRLQQLSNNEPVGEPIDPQTNAQAPLDNGFRLSGEHYIYNLDTGYLSQGQYRLMVDLGDGSALKTLDIGFK